MRKIIVVVMLLAVVMFYTITPKYPVPDSSLSNDNTVIFISKVLKEESRNFDREYMDHGGVPVEYIQSGREMFAKMKKCDDRECLISAYTEHMDKWTSDRLRIMTRGQVMVDNFGIIGEKINQSVGMLY